MAEPQQQKNADSNAPTGTTIAQKSGKAPLIYPPAAATHSELVADPQLFLKTLAAFTSVMESSDLVVPRVGGKELQMHRLYCEVTQLGGLEKVTAEKRWGIVAGALDLPQVVTMPVYFLRMHYTTLLHHFEQVYFHGKQGRPLIAPPGPLPKPMPVQEYEKLKRSYAIQAGDHPEPVPAGRKPELKVDHGAAVGQTVSGTIDGKLEQGYLVTVVVGSKKLRGVIYVKPQNKDVVEEGGAGNEVEAGAGEGPSTGARAKPESAEPIRGARSPYNFFVAEQRQQLTGVLPREKKSRVIGDMWNALSAVERLPYMKLAEDDKKRFQDETQERMNAAKQPEIIEID